MNNIDARSRRDAVRRSIALVAVAAVAAALLWPAILNGFPLLFPDSITYLGQGHGILSKLRGLATPLWSYDSLRSETYSIALVPLHLGAVLWPIVAAQALLTSWIVWLVIRSLCPRSPLKTYLALSIALAACSGVAWYVSFLMPDILGSLLYLAFFLLVITPETLHAWERWTLTAFALWAITTHGVYPLLAAGLCALFAVLWIAGWTGMANRGRRLALFAAIVILAAASQSAIHARLYGKASMAGHSPAILMARLLEDGPARLYLQSHCANSPWAICTHAGNLPTTDGAFLWDADGIWQTSTPAQQDALRREQTPLLLATLRTYPMQQAARSLRNFGRSLITLGPADFGAPVVFTPAFLNFGADGLDSRYASTKQAQSLLPQNIYSALLRPVIVLALVILCALLPRAWRRHELPLLALAWVVIFTLLANAFVSGVFGGVFARYQGRVVWMAVLLAGLCVASEFQAHARIPANTPA